MKYRLTTDGFLGKPKGSKLTDDQFRAAFDSDQAAASRLGSLLRSGILVELDEAPPAPEAPLEPEAPAPKPKPAKQAKKVKEVSDGDSSFQATD